LSFTPEHSGGGATWRITRAGSLKLLAGLSARVLLLLHTLLEGLLLLLLVEGGA